MTATTKTTTKPTADKIDFKKIFADKKAKFDQCFKEYKKLKDLWQLPDNLGKMYYKQNWSEYLGSNPYLMYLQGAKAGVYVPMHYLYDIKMIEGKKKDWTPYKRPKKVWKYNYDFNKTIMVSVPMFKKVEGEDGETTEKLARYTTGMVIHEDDIVLKDHIKEQEEATQAIAEAEAIEQTESVELVFA